MDERQKLLNHMDKHRNDDPMVVIYFGPNKFQLMQKSDAVLSDKIFIGCSNSLEIWSINEDDAFQAAVFAMETELA